MLNPELLLPRLGVDESGKGDFFGPLCVAGAYVNESVVKAWKDSGIRDSKNISSDNKIRELAELIRDTPGCISTVVPIGNEAYNRLYQTMRSVNTMRSSVDVFMGSVLVAVLQFGALTSVRAGPGLVAFAAVVIITMFATASFDARLMWDAARGRP